MTDFVAPTLEDVRAAAARIASHARVTPVLRNDVLDGLAGAHLFFKCEHLQRGGAFKFRGACNAVWSLADDEAKRGVVTHSSGNHGAALALAAKTRGIPAYIMVPEGAVAAKLANIERAGGIVHRCAATLAAREETCARVQQETGATLVHPYTDARVIAGQGSVALELLQQVPDLDAVVVPVGGGGLISGFAIV
ncbi:MAG: pyridoxal-phosphate dependent enzyme, partial [Rhodanobacteraceae bacterium]